MGLFMMAILSFGIALVVRRQEALVLRWQPSQHTWVAIGTGLLVFALSASLLLFALGAVETRIIHYGLIYVLCGMAIPWGYTLLIEQNALSALGLSRQCLVTSIVLGLVAAGLMSPLLLSQINGSTVDWNQMAKGAVVLTGAGGLFELFLYYGFIHLRLEKAFGVIPAILGAAALYVLWHVGTQLRLEPDPYGALWKLFLVGVMYQSLFSITRNLLIIWPFFHLVGVMIDFVVNLNAVQTVMVEFPWAVMTMLAMAIIGLVLIVLTRNRVQRFATETLS